MVKCPSCKKDALNSSREWTYAAFHVKRYDCSNCGKSFKAYYHKGKFSHTIPKSK